VSTKWLQHVEGIIVSALLVHKFLTTGSANVLVYCNKGTNGTPVLTSLA